ncbi:MAG: hypothetical protein PUB73_05945 [Bacteroidales bacterium]|nr:hypothetical protein [Bacteroidales bacterium]
MAAAQLNFNESQLDTSSALYDLYSRLYNGMVAANQVDAPNYLENPPLTEEGEVDQAAINAGLSSYSTILMKNSAYLYATAILAVVGEGGSGAVSGGANCILRAGDSMSGSLAALYGFKAGVDNVAIFELERDTVKNNTALVHGTLKVDKDVNIKGKLTIAEDQGLYFGSTEVLYLDANDGALHINSDKVIFDGNIELTGIAIGSISITESGIFFGDNEYYHAGNSNLSTVNWSMQDGHAYGTFQVDGTTTLKGLFSAKYGFSLGDNDTQILYSVYDSESDGRPIIKLASDLDILTGYGIKFQDKYIIKVRSGSENVVSFSAPGKILNLGDSDGTTATTHIALQSDIYNASSAYRIISKSGDGNFPNSFSAGCGNSGPTVMQTYYASATDMGVVFQRKLRLGTSEGPYISGEEGIFELASPYTYVDSNGESHSAMVPITIQNIKTTSQFRDLSLPWSATTQFDTDSEFFAFAKPVEGVEFSIKSENYKTRLIENTLFLDDGVWIEGVEGGMSIHGNAFFSGSLSTQQFASGFAGYGWAINQNALYGGYEATFDNLTIRKKMRIYELEVQKISATNGSLWVSDSCSGDTVEEILN